MLVTCKIIIPSGLVFDFTNMFGTGRLQEEQVAQEINGRGAAAEKAVQQLRRTGQSKKHLSKDGTPEHVYFMRMPYPEEGNPNTEASLAKLKEYSKYLQNFDVILFLGVGGSYLGNKVLFDAFGGYYWNTNYHMRHGQPRIYFSGNNLDPVDCNAIIYEIDRLLDKHGKDGHPLRVMLTPISKSGTTLETIAAFTYFYDKLSSKENIEVECTVVTDLQADIAKAPLLQIAERFHSWKFEIKERNGGHYCVMTHPRLNP